MLKIQEIREMIKLIDQSSIEEFVYEHDGTKVHMKKPSAAVPVEAVVKTVVEPAPKVVVKEEAPQAPAKAASAV
jgi:acetyl-CoA carboxylase biotin carboxyl carrier protein